MFRFLWFLLVGLLLAAPARAEEDLTPDQVAAYVALVKSDQARDRGASQEALQGYRGAMEKYSAIGRKNPLWHPELVRYRVAYCANEIELLRRRLEQGAAPDSPAPPVLPVAAAPAVEAAPAAPRAPDPDDLQRRLAEYESVARATQDVQRLESANAALVEEQQRLTGEVRRLQEALAALQTAALATQDVARLEAANRDLTEERARLAKEAEHLRGSAQERDDAAAQAAARLQTENQRLAEEGERMAKDIGDLREHVAGLLAAAQVEGGMLRAAEAAQQSRAEQGAAMSNSLAAALGERDALQQKLELAGQAAAQQQEKAQEQAQALAGNARLVEELAGLSNRFAAVSREHDELSAALGKAEEARDELQARLKDAAAQALAAEELTRDREKVLQAQKKAEDQADVLGKQHAALMSQKEALEKRTEELYRQTQELDRSGKACEEARRALAGTNEVLRASLAEASRAEAAAREAHGAQIEALQSQVREITEQADAVRQTIELQEKDLARVRELKKRVSALEEEKETLAKSLAERQREIGELRDEGAIEQLTAQGKALRQELDETKALLEKSEKEARELLKENTFLKRRS